MSDVVEIGGKTYIVITQDELNTIMAKSREEGAVAARTEYYRSCKKTEVRWYAPGTGD